MESNDKQYESNQLFRWVDNLPKPATQVKPMAKEQVMQLYNASLALPYRGEWDESTQSYKIDPLFRGLTYGEVIILKQVMAAAAGDQKASEDVINRVAGKPKIAVEQVSMNLSYTEFLEMSAKQSIEEGDVIDVVLPQVITEEYDESLLEGI